jgi:hypothetical protein
MPMTATRRDLIRLIVDLVHATQFLAHATEENTRISKLLRADLARMSRRGTARRSARPRRGRRPGPPPAVGTPHLRLVAGAGADLKDGEPAGRRPVLPAPVGPPGVAATQAPPTT